MCDLTDRVVSNVATTIIKRSARCVYEERLTLTHEIDRSGTIYQHEIFPSDSIERAINYDEVNVIVRINFRKKSLQRLVKMLWNMKITYDS